MGAYVRSGRGYRDAVGAPAASRADAIYDNGSDADADNVDADNEPDPDVDDDEYQ